MAVSCMGHRRPGRFRVLFRQYPLEKGTPSPYRKNPGILWSYAHIPPSMPPPIHRRNDVTKPEELPCSSRFTAIDTTVMIRK